MDAKFRAQVLERIAAETHLKDEYPDDGERELEIVGQVFDELAHKAPVSQGVIAEALVVRGLGAGPYSILIGLHKAINSR